MATKKKTQTKAVTKAQKNDLSFLKGQDVDLGVDSISAEDIQIPRIKICQAMSTVKEDNKSIKDGDIYNAASGKIIKQPVRFFVLLHWKSTIWFSDDRTLLAVSYYDKEQKKDVVYGQDTSVIKNDPEAGMDSHNYFIISEEKVKSAIQSGSKPLPTIFSTMSAANKYARQLNSMIKMQSGNGIPIYGTVFELKTVSKKFKAGTAYMPVFTQDRVFNKTEFVYLQKYYEMCKSLQQKAGIDIEEVEPTESSAPKQSGNKKPEPEKQPDLDLSDDDIPI